jgi:hypothetical protein
VAQFAHPIRQFVFFIALQLVLDSSGSGNVPLAVAGRVTHFANGTESGVATASVNGVLSTVPFKGTLTLNPDGVSWSETVIQTSPPFFTLHYILYPTPDGNFINEVETDPGTTAAGVLTRGSPTEDEH